MKKSSLCGIILIGFIVTEQFYTAVNYRMLVIAAIILLMVWPDFKRFLIRRYVWLVRAVRFIFTPSRHF